MSTHSVFAQIQNASPTHSWGDLKNADPSFGQIARQQGCFTSPLDSLPQYNNESTVRMRSLYRSRDSQAFLLPTQSKSIGDPDDLVTIIDDIPFTDPLPPKKARRKRAAKKRAASKQFHCEAEFVSAGSDVQQETLTDKIEAETRREDRWTDFQLESSGISVTWKTSEVIHADEICKIIKILKEARSMS